MTETEAQIVALIRSGMGTREVIQMLHVGANTVTQTTQRYIPADERRRLRDKLIGKRRRKREERAMTHEGLNRVMARELRRSWR